MVKNRKALLLSATLLASSLAVSPGVLASSLTTNQANLISAGSYFTAQGAFPLLLSSQDSGQSWSFIKNVPLFSNHVSHFLNAVACNGNRCFVAGNFGAGASALLLMQSEDKGQTWSYVTKIANQPALESSYLNDVSCNHNTCFATGMYFNFSQNNFGPALVTSQDGGVNWTFITQIANGPSDADLIDQMTCTAKSCVGLLEYDASMTGNLHTSPIFSKDQGRSWTFVKDIIGLPPHKAVDLESVDCSPDICLAGGRYYPAKKNAAPLPLLIASQDGGEHWQTLTIAHLPTMTYGVISSVAYQKAVWVASGRYAIGKDSEMNLPLLLTGDAAGTEWSAIENVTGLPQKSIRLQTIHCEENGLCLAGGYYLKNVQVAEGYELPVLLVSHDYGDSYHFVKDIANLPALKGATINSLSCANNICTAIGHYDDMRSGKTHQDAIYFPLILTSQDEGEHWTALTLNGIPAMESGEVVSITGGKNIFSHPKK